jgi:hypothetical protein
VDPASALLVFGAGILGIALAARAACRPESETGSDDAPIATLPWHVQALYVPAFFVFFYLGIAPTMSRGFEAAEALEGRTVPGLFERLLGEPSDLVALGLALTAVVALAIGYRGARVRASLQSP